MPNVYHANSNARPNHCDVCKISRADHEHSMNFGGDGMPDYWRYLWLCDECQESYYVCKCDTCYSLEHHLISECGNYV